MVFVKQVDEEGEAQGVVLESQATPETFKYVFHLLHIFDQNVRF